VPESAANEDLRVRRATRPRRSETQTGAAAASTPWWVLRWPRGPLCSHRMRDIYSLLALWARHAGLRSRKDAAVGKRLARFDEC